MTPARWNAARRIGWILIAVFLVGIAFWVVAKAVMDARAFDRWVGWANILALLAGAVGTALVVLDRVERHAQRSMPAEPSSVQHITAHWGGVAQGAQGPGSRIINYVGTEPGSSTGKVSRGDGGLDEARTANRRRWWRRLWRRKR